MASQTEGQETDRGHYLYTTAEIKAKNTKYLFRSFDKT